MRWFYEAIYSPGLKQHDVAKQRGLHCKVGNLLLFWPRILLHPYQDNSRALHIYLFINKTISLKSSPSTCLPLFKIITLVVSGHWYQRTLKEDQELRRVKAKEGRCETHKLFFRWKFCFWNNANKALLPYKKKQSFNWCLLAIGPPPLNQNFIPSFTLSYLLIGP